MNQYKLGDTFIVVAFKDTNSPVYKEVYIVRIINLYLQLAFKDKNHHDILAKTKPLLAINNTPSIELLSEIFWEIFPEELQTQEWKDEFHTNQIKQIVGLE